MYYVIVIFSTAVFSLGVTRYLARSFFSLCRSTISQLDIIIDVSLTEEVKEKLLLRQLKELLRFLLTSIMIFFAIILISLLPVYAYVELTGVEKVDMSSFYFVASMILGSGALFFMPKGTSDYSYWSRLLHTIILDNYSISQWLFRLQKKRLKTGTGIRNKDFVIVTGLARGGTTALTEMLFRSNKFHSIKYSNMPFLMAPKLWSKFHLTKNEKLKERAHGDQLLVGVNSIEALEEHFFKAFLRDSYINKGSLVIHKIDQSIYQSYRIFQGFYQQEMNTIYLSKNNNYLLRHQSMRKHNDQFKVIIMFRNPLEHALSLMRQHKNFYQQQAEDKFTLDYMNWLGHYEFGSNQKVFDFEGEKLWEQFERTDVNYWLAVWINYYQFVLTLGPDSNLFLVDYSDFLCHPNQLKERLAQELNVSLGGQKEALFEKKATQENQMQVEENLLKIANSIFGELGEQKMVIYTQTT